MVAVGGFLLSVKKEDRTAVGVRKLADEAGLARGPGLDPEEVPGQGALIPAGSMTTSDWSGGLPTAGNSSS
jgi:hypothetical protein